jgi:anionic cell wall polymer biosynthesis LytR-Cps2A-Psr (LCP) family protein
METTGRRAARSGARAARREAQRLRRQQRFGRFLWLSAVGSWVPGVGLLAAGKRGWGGFMLTLVGLGVLGLGVIVWRVPRRQLAVSTFDQSLLRIASVGLVVAAATWLVVAVASHRALEPAGLSDGRRLAGALVVIVASSLVVAPMAHGARLAWTQHELLAAVSSQGSTSPEVDAANPWEDLPRLNILLLGVDRSEERSDTAGILTDTMILASIDTTSGDTVMFSLPRNLERVPFPPNSELVQHFPDGFTNGQPEDARYFLNAVYNHLPQPDFLPPELADEVFADSDDPGADAIKLAVAGALGVDVHYYVMANMDGFQDIVDAMGGVTIDVPYPVAMNTKTVDGGGCTWTRRPEEWILPGEQRLSGVEALWFARNRCTPDHPDYLNLYDELGGNPVKDDYNRMDRQRCMMSAIAARAEPLNLLANFEGLAAAAERTVTTDIPVDVWPSLADLGLTVQGATMTSLPFTRDVITPGNPDYFEIHALVQDALTPEARGEADASQEPSSTEESPGDGDEPDGNGEAGDGDQTEGDAEQSDPDGDPAEIGDDQAEAPSADPDPTEPADVSAACGA